MEHFGHGRTSPGCEGEVRQPDTPEKTVRQGKKPRFSLFRQTLTDPDGVYKLYIRSYRAPNSSCCCRTHSCSTRYGLQGIHRQVCQSVRPLVLSGSPVGTDKLSCGSLRPDGCSVSRADIPPHWHAINSDPATSIAGPPGVLHGKGQSLTMG